MMRRIAAILVILGATLTTSGARGQEPCAGCTIPPVWISPEAVPQPYKIIANAFDHPVEVRIQFPPALCDLLVLCDTTYSVCEMSCEGVSFVDTTEFIPKEGGMVARFSIRGGGCWNEEVVSDPAHLVQIYVDGELVRRVGVRSPDVVSSTGIFPWDLWCEAPPDTAGSSLVGLEDMTTLTPFFKSGTYSPCADMNGDHAVDLTDGVMATDAMKAGSSCGER